MRAQVTSPRNPQIAAAAKLQRTRARRDALMTLLEGPHLLGEAVAAGAPVVTVFALTDDAESHLRAEALGARLITVSVEALHRLAPTEHPRGPVAVMRYPLPTGPLTELALVLWGVRDPGNVGALIRSAAAFAMSVGIGPDTADPWSPKALRGGAGGHFHTGIFEWKQPGGPDGRPVAALLANGGQPPESIRARPLALLVGEEAAGLPAEVVAAAEFRITVPTRGVESLNAAVAGSLVAYEMTRSRPSEPD